MYYPGGVYMATYGRRPPRRRDERLKEIAVDSGRNITGITGAGIAEEASRIGGVAPAAVTSVPEIKGPWMRDQITLSMEAKLILLESRAHNQLSLADLNYMNSITILELRNGIYVKIEPTGCYCLSWRPN